MRSINPLQELVELSSAERQRLGAVHTPAEIWRQPELWEITAARTADFLRSMENAAHELISEPGAHVILTGAGSSWYVGDCLAPTLRRVTGRNVMSIESTEIVTHPEILGAPGPLILVSLARSGDSPESLGVYRLARRIVPGAFQVVITCNGGGELAKKARADGHLCLELDPRTNDRGLAMTSSFTNLFLAGLGLAYLHRIAEYRRLGAETAEAGRRLLASSPDILAGLVRDGFTRAVFLGSGPLCGAAREMALKTLEMNDGGIASLAQSYLGLRHGPMSFLTEQTLVVAMRSGEEYVRLYEDDLINQLAAKSFDGRLLNLDPLQAGVPSALKSTTLRLCGDGPVLPDAWLPALAVPMGQILALFSSLKSGCRPDQPSGRGLISRVVQGVVLYDERWRAGA